MSDESYEVIILIIVRRRTQNWNEWRKNTTTQTIDEFYDGCCCCWMVQSKVILNVILTAMTAIPKAKSTKTINQKRSVHPLTCNGIFLFSESLLKHPPILSYNSLLIVLSINFFFLMLCVFSNVLFFILYDDTRWWHKFQYPNWINRRLFYSNSF